jgi:hypothetical protein
MDSTNHAGCLPTGMFCPLCGSEVLLPDEMWSRHLLNVIRIRMEDLGTQVECDRCRKSFVHRHAKWSATWRKPA